MRRLIAFFAAINPGRDAGAWRRIALSFVLFGGAGCLALLVAPALGLSGTTGVEHWLRMAHGPWALPAAVAAFAALAFLGAPQIVLIAAAAVVFGAWMGALYAWIGTFVSSLIGFELGRLFGGRVIGELRSARVERFMGLVGRNGFMASFAVRLIPLAPFVVINMAAGAARVRRTDFLLGTGVGIVPKILITAFAGGTVAAAFKGGAAIQLAVLGVAVLIWAAAGFAARRWMQSRAAAAVETARKPS